MNSQRVRILLFCKDICLVQLFILAVKIFVDKTPINSISRDISCVDARCGPDGAAARSQSCLSFDVAVVPVVSSSLPRHQRNYATTQTAHDDLPSHDIFEYPETFTNLRCNSYITMEFGHAGVLNEGTIRAAARHSADDPSLT